MVALWTRGGVFHRHPKDDQQEEVSQRLVEAVIDHFMGCLRRLDVRGDSWITRASLRHGELRDLIVGKAHIAERLRALPPGVREALVPLIERDDPRLTALLDLVDSASSTAGEGAGSLVADRNAWLGGLSGAGTCGSCGVEFSSRGEGRSISTLRNGFGAFGAARRDLAIAALLARDDDEDRSRDFIVRSKAIGPIDLLISAYELAINNDSDGILRAVNPDDAIAEPRLVGLLAAALIDGERSDEALALLRRATDAMEADSDEEVLSGLDLMAARILLKRVVELQSTNRAADVAEALHRCTRGRDNRRRWRLDSSEAVAVACAAATLSHDQRTCRIARVPAT